LCPQDAGVYHQAGLKCKNSRLHVGPDAEEEWVEPLFAYRPSMAASPAPIILGCIKNACGQAARREIPLHASPSFGLFKSSAALIPIFFIAKLLSSAISCERPITGKKEGFPWEPPSIKKMRPKKSPSPS
jgi:hypothetical protein